MTSAAPITPIIANEAPTPITEPHPPEDFPSVVVSVPEVLSGDVTDVVSVTVVVVVAGSSPSHLA